MTYVAISLVYVYLIVPTLLGSVVLRVVFDCKGLALRMCVRPGLNGTHLEWQAAGLFLLMGGNVLPLGLRGIVLKG